MRTAMTSSLLSQSLSLHTPRRIQLYTSWHQRPGLSPHEGIGRTMSCRDRMALLLWAALPTTPAVAHGYTQESLMKNCDQYNHSRFHQMQVKYCLSEFSGHISKYRHLWFGHLGAACWMTGGSGPFQAASICMGQHKPQCKAYLI